MIPQTTPPVESILAARAVAHSFGGRRVLNGVDFDLFPGEAVAIRGPSGSGKTTLLAILGGLLHPDEGAVRQAVRPGWVLQTTNAIPTRTALENAGLACLVDGETETDAGQRALAALQAVGLFARRHDLARKLSGGELQRVSVARALASRRRLVLADEPTGQLDAGSATVVAEALVGLCVEGRGLVVATHDPVVAAYCHRVLDLKSGALHLAPSISSHESGRPS